jgi:hypothetical protein
LRYVTQSNPLPLSFFSPDKTNPKQTNSLHLFHPLWFSANGKCEDDTQYAAGSMQNNIFTSSNTIKIYHPKLSPLTKIKQPPIENIKIITKQILKKNKNKINSFECSCTRAQENFKRNQNYKKKKNNSYQNKFLNVSFYLVDSFWFASQFYMYSIVWYVSFFLIQK